MTSAMPRHALVPASYVYLRRGDEVLLQQRHHTGYMDEHWVAGAAGHIERGQSARSAAAREAFEEMGVTIDVDDLVPITVMQRGAADAEAIEHRVDWFFEATRWQGDPTVMEPEKCAAMAWFPLTDLPEPMPAYERAVLEWLAAGDAPMLSVEPGWIEQ